MYPLSLKYLEEAGISTTGLFSKSWDTLESFQPDIAITLCDSAAGESCPLWLGSSLKVHWGLEDPSKLQGTEEELAQAFRNTIEEITQRVKQLANLNIDLNDKDALKSALATLGAH